MGARVLQAGLTGVLLGIGFIVPVLWWIGVIAIMCSLYTLKTSSSYKQAITLLVTIWWIKSLCSLSWYVSIYPIEWLEIESQTMQIILLTLYWFTSSLWLSLGGIVLAVVGRFLYIQNYISTVIWYCLMPGVWLLCELLSGVTFALFSYGPGSIIDSYFVSFGMVGYLLGTSSVGIWLAAFAGVYGLTIFVVCVACCLLFLVQAKKYTALILCVIVVVLMNLWCSWQKPLYRSRDITVLSIDTQFDATLLSTVKGEQFKNNTVAVAVNSAVSLSPSFILLPEDSRYLYAQFDSRYPKQAMSMFQFSHQNTETILIDTGRHVTEEGVTVLRANIFDGISKQLWQFDKQFLVPQGEYVPYLYNWFFTSLGLQSAMKDIVRASSYQPGPLIQSASLPDYVPGVLFCFESSSPTGVPTLQNNRSLPFVAHPISHAWFYMPKILWQQLDVMLLIQARFSNLPIVSAGNMATGKLYLPNGEIQSGEIIEWGDRYLLREFKF